MVRLITGYAGVGHVTSADAGRFNAGVCGRKAYVMQTGEMFAYTLKSNNEIVIGSGDLVDQGRHFSIPQNSSETLTLDNGSQNKSRYDTVALRYTKNSDNGIESASIHVVKGTEVVKTATPPYPQLTSGDIFSGDLVDDIPLYHIKITDLSIEKVEQAFKVIPSLAGIADVIYPVGSIYMSMNKTNPAELFGGTWQQITGTFLFPYTNSRQTGGEHFIQLTKDNLPEHTHNLPRHTHEIAPHTHTATVSTAGAHTHTFAKIKGAASGTARYVPEDAGSISTASSGTVKTSSAGGHTHAVKIDRTNSQVTEQNEASETASAGKGKAFNNMPPYVTVYAWERTS